MLSNLVAVCFTPDLAELKKARSETHNMSCGFRYGLTRCTSLQLNSNLRYLNICIILSGVVTILPFCPDAFV